MPRGRPASNITRTKISLWIDKSLVERVKLILGNSSPQKSVSMYVEECFLKLLKESRNDEN